MAILETSGLTKSFGGLTAVNNVSLAVERAEIFSIIGPNGAGKSTMFKLIGSFLRPSAGEIRLDGENITGLKPNLVAQKGVVRTFQETTIFKEMTALDNVVVGHHLQSRSNLLGYFFNTRQARADNARFRESAAEILDYLGLGHVKGDLARNLPHGYLRALGIALGLAAGPKVLLLDEPFAGMNHEETQRAVGMVRAIRDRGVTVLLVEHDMPAVMQISDRIAVLNFGEKIAEGTPEEIQRNDAVIEAYLGREDEEIGV